MTVVSSSSPPRRPSSSSSICSVHPPPWTYSADSSGQVNVTLQTVGTYGFGQPPDLGLLPRPVSRRAVGSTRRSSRCPQHVRINVTIYQYDSGSPLRNQQLGQVTGTYGNVATLNGKPFQVINSNAGNGVAHTFSMPSLGINVPLYGNSSNANLCGAAPCTTSSPHKVIRFSFTSPGPGNYRWQCFVPCGLGFLYGNGGPMSTLGYMGGFMKVVA